MIFTNLRFVTNLHSNCRLVVECSNWSHYVASTMLTNFAKLTCRYNVTKLRLMSLYIFGTEPKLKVHRFTNSLQDLQKVMVKDFSWIIIPWNALLFEKTHVTTRRNVRKQRWVFPLFSPDSDVRLSLIFHRFVILYISCDTRSVGLWTILFTESVQWLSTKKHR